MFPNLLEESVAYVTFVLMSCLFPVSLTEPWFAWYTLSSNVRFPMKWDMCETLEIGIAMVLEKAY